MKKDKAGHAEERAGNRKQWLLQHWSRDLNEMRGTVWPSWRRTSSMEGTAHAKTLRQEWISVTETRRDHDLQHPGLLAGSWER